LRKGSGCGDELVQLGAQDAGDGPVHGVIGTVTPHEYLEAEPRDPPSGLDCGLPEDLEEH